jgi:hypothetical protein
MHTFGASHPPHMLVASMLRDTKRMLACMHAWHEVGGAELDRGGVAMRLLYPSWRQLQGCATKTVVQLQLAVPVAVHEVLRRKRNQVGVCCEQVIIVPHILHQARIQPPDLFSTAIIMLWLGVQGLGFGLYAFQVHDFGMRGNPVNRHAQARRL